ncbi:hypothetical protein Taro_023113 [Colocasia esculenta]|uniref:Uncharacterized protein n=1 Tax=Colocasia esculenta TaxID=4460 RepID=A0A843VGF4_COLES|nr:hypothetical protein [Colocasia esculenta]
MTNYGRVFVHRKEEAHGRGKELMMAIRPKSKEEADGRGKELTTSADSDFQNDFLQALTVVQESDRRRQTFRRRRAAAVMWREPGIIHRLRRSAEQSPRGGRR